MFILLIFLALMPLIALTPKAKGATFTVINLNDSGEGSLRWAIEEANANSGEDYIMFDSSLSGTIVLNSPLPQITEAVTIDGSTAGGPITIDGSTYNVANCFTITVWWGTTTIKSLKLVGFTEYGVIVTQGLDEVYLESLDISGCGYGGVAIIRYSWGTLSFSVRIQYCNIHENGGVGIAVRASGVYIYGCEIYMNQGAGVYITVDGANNGVTDVNIVGNQIHHNYAEGVLIKGNVFDSHIGSVDEINTIEYNSFGGVTLVSDSTAGPTSNYIVNNHVKFNGFQDIAIVGEGTKFNKVNFNYVTSDENTMKTIGITLKDGADENTIHSNIISNHYYEGIAIIGPETNNNVVTYNKIGAFNEYGNPTGNRLDGNGAGILVGNAAFPDIHYPFPVYGSPLQGPSGTKLENNWVLQNRGAGIILIKATNFVADGNTVEDNELWGFYWVGSTGTADNNNVIENDLDGFRIEPYYGESASPDPPGTNDDMLSSSNSVSGNVIRNNGEYGFRFLDNPSWLFPENLLKYNQFGDNGIGWISYYWLGYGRVFDESGNPAIKKTVKLFKNDGDFIADYIWDTWDNDGRYGSTGFIYNDISTWEKIISGEIDNNGIIHHYNPYRFKLDGEERNEIYAWNGIYPDPPNESGGAIESPLRSRVYRYQYVQLSLAEQPPSPSFKPTPVGGKLYSSNKLAILAPYIVLVGLASMIAVTVKRRRR
ncbi:MAG: right-handed parallel beta-helix repeat-containing protein [Candidatus Bathyarchaeia archaeon]